MARAIGLMVAIEGVDAVGKRTQSILLDSRLRSMGFKSNTMSFPDYGTTIGREIREYLHGKRAYSLEVGHMLYAINRWEKKGVITDILGISDALIINRYSPSNLAYGVAKGLKLEWLANLEKGLPDADLVVVLDAPPSALTSRRTANKDDYERDMELQERVRTAYLRLARDFSWVVIDAARSKTETNDDLVSAVTKALAAGGGMR